MKKWLLLFLLLCALLPCTASAAGLSGLVSGAGALPDPADLLGVPAFLYEEDVIDNGLTYAAFTFPMPDDYEAFLIEYAAAARAAGYAVDKSRILKMEAHRVSSGAKAAYLIPDYRGALLFLVGITMDYAPLPTPTPTPCPTPKPTPIPDAPSAGSSTGSSAYTPQTGGSSVQYIQVKQDCFACTGGVCSLCHGSGWYRNYGESVPCPIFCQTCDGLGHWYITQPVWVP